jgi:AmmeMemoRadiSam system protein B/AmmeMemoRadiSam system protein A
MRNVRPAAVAGSFYTDNAGELQRQLSAYLRDGHAASNRPKAVIAPHAGYIYSGPVAGSAYAAVAPLKGQIRRVVLLGPAHRVYVAGIAASSASAFATPLGEVDLDQDAIATLVGEFPFVTYVDAAHAAEHSLEVQLPFLQSILGDFKLLPFAVGGATPPQVERLLDRLWGGPETLIVISSDLSHYHDYDTARQLDRYTSERIAQFDPASLTSDHACGQIPIRGLLRAAVKHGLRCEVLDVRNSGDTAGSRDRVVGYGAYALYEADEEGETPTPIRRRLTKLARDSIVHGLEQGRPLPVESTSWPASVRRPGASFVTLNRHQQLRGCIGSLNAHRPLPLDIAENAYSAAFKDPRFQPLEASELDALEIHISRLSVPQPLQYSSPSQLLAQLRPGIDGLILREGSYRGTFLPSVWESIPERDAFLAQLKRKAGLPADYWSDTIQVERYTTECW